MKGVGGRVSCRRIASIVIALAFMLSLSWAARAVAQDDQQQSLAEKLLIILKQNHQITQEQYDELLKEAQQEKAAQKAAVQKQVQAETVQAAKEEKEKNPLKVTASWKHDEVYFESNNGQFTMHVGGYVQADFSGATVNDRLWTALSKVGGIADVDKLNSYGVELRRVKPTIEGTLYGDFDYKLQIDFGGGSETLQDIWMTYYGLPCFANIRVGHMKDPFSLEELTSDEWLEFTERSVANAFITANQYSDRNTGILLFNDAFNQRATWAVGSSIQQDNSSGTSFQPYNNVNVTARVTALPWYADNGCDLIHLGFGFRNLFRTDNPGSVNNGGYTELEFLNTPDWHLAGLKMINTGPIVASNVAQINPEFAFNYGPFSVQGEYFDSFLDNATMYYYSGTTLHNTKYSSPDLNGYYIQASYFITGEHRAYDPRFGVFARPIPNCNFNPSAGGWGAWEVAGRFDGIDLNDETIRGGTENDWNAALNWYMNPNFKWTFEYTFAHINGAPVTSASGPYSSFFNVRNGDANIFDTRFQVDF